MVVDAVKYANEADTILANAGLGNTTVEENEKRITDISKYGN